MISSIDFSDTLALRIFLVDNIITVISNPPIIANPKVNFNSTLKYMSKCLITTPFMVWNTLSIQKTSASQTTPFKAWWHIVFLIFKNKIMISNPGGLVKWMKPEEFGTVSRPRNQIIAELLSKTIYVEKLGTGINRIKNAMKEAGLPAPEFKYSFSFFTTLFDITGGEGKIEGGQIGGLESGQIGGHILTERQNEILAIIKNNPRITRIELSQKLKINPSAIQKHLVSLKKVKLLKRIGSAKSGYWETLEK